MAKVLVVAKTGAALATRLEINAPYVFELIPEALPPAFSAASAMPTFAELVSVRNVA
jgi:hypothetical protein